MPTDLARLLAARVAIDRAIDAERRVIAALLLLAKRLGLCLLASLALTGCAYVEGVHDIDPAATLVIPAGSSIIPPDGCHTLLIDADGRHRPCKMLIPRQHLIAIAVPDEQTRRPESPPDPEPDLIGPPDMEGDSWLSLRQLARRWMRN